MQQNIVWLGDIGFPVGMAPVQKTYLICKALVECGAHTTVISRKGPHSPGRNPDIASQGRIDNIEYIYASGSPYRPDNPVVRTLLKFRGLVNEVVILFKMKRKGKLDAAILHTNKFSSILYYRLLSKLFRFTLLMAYVELYSSITSRTNPLLLVNDYLYERYGFRLMDGIMPISDFLCDFVRDRNPALPILKVPMITDFGRFEGVEKKSTEKYFLFCGSALYIEVISFILSAFQAIPVADDVKLYLVSNGSDSQIRRLSETIGKCKKKNLIKVFSGISDEQLTQLYKNACGLLIPLRPTVQDTARFPHKLGEYLASGNPVITTKVGEIPKYFSDQESALIAENYNVEDFAKKMQFVISNPEISASIGEKGRSVARLHFSYKDYGPRIIEFIASVRPSS